LFIFAVGLPVFIVRYYTGYSLARRNICTIWYREAHFSLPCQKARVLQLNQVFILLMSVVQRMLKTTLQVQG